MDDEPTVRVLEAARAEQGWSSHFPKDKLGTISDTGQ